MSLKSIIGSTLIFFLGLPRKKLVEIIDVLRKRYVNLEKEYKALELANKKLEGENKALKSSALKSIEKKVNQEANKPSSKQAEWEKKGVGNDGKGKKKGRGKKGRKGAGNKTKNKTVTKKETARVDSCSRCGASLMGQPALATKVVRIIDDIPTAPVELDVIEVTQEKKYCKNCQQVTTASTDLGLPKADVGINTTVQLVYLWVKTGMPFTRISEYLKDFYNQLISTAGLSAHVIRVGKILQPVYEEILEDIRKSKRVHADESGWRVNGDRWWLWVVGNQESAYYTIDKSRGKDVIHRILGQIFMGVLIVDGWKAYLSVICEQQSCMAHLLRKIRKLFAAFPKLRSVFKFYMKLRRILRDGQRLQAKRDSLGEQVFERRLKKLHNRLDQLLKWKNPNDILQKIINMTRNQRDRILTFVEHPDIPCHNNFGEYLIRIGVLKRKISFGSKSPQGAQAYAVLLSIYMTCKLRGIPFLDFLKSSLQQYSKTGKPLLIKHHTQNQTLLSKVA